MDPTDGTTTLANSNTCIKEEPMDISDPPVINQKVDVALLKGTMTGKKILSKERPDDNARHLASTLTLEEQISLLAGSDFWRTVAIPSRGIPSIKTTDGPNGARGAFFKNGTPAALFPAGVSLASTWNLELMYEVGQHLAAETRARGADVLLGPTVCLHRSPLGGRNFESFSEDPYLTGKVATAYIQGLQKGGVGATIKHYAVNEQETWRMTVNCAVAERPLRELYLRPFEMAVRDAKPWAIMSSYNQINGTHGDMNDHTLREILRNEWKFDGCVMSDWTGTNSVAESIQVGCDLEMPGPTKWRGERVLRAVESGQLSREAVERSAGNVLYLIERVCRGKTDMTEPPERSDDVPERRELIRRAGAQGLTLLKNEGVLPIAADKKIALIGPNAKRAIVHGGGSASVKPYYTTTPFDGLQAQVGSELLYARGCDTNKWLPLVSDANLTTPDGVAGVIVEFYHGDMFKGSPAFVHHKSQTDLFLWDSAPMEVLPAYSFKVKAKLTPVTTGYHTFGFMTVGPGRFFINGELFIDNWDWTEEGEAMFDGSIDVIKSVHLEAGVTIDILVESTNEVRPMAKKSFSGRTHQYGGCRIGFQEEFKADLIAEAVEVAQQADVAIVCVGLDDEWESEGYDRSTMDLPKDGSQDRLISAVVKANPNTIVVNQSGTPVTMPWADEVPAIIQAWYQGQEAGNALADVLLGYANPSGKLPTTFPKRLADNPAYHNWPGENEQVVYGEGMYMGYRHYDRTGIEPLFSFGHGLSYTTFSYGEPTISSKKLSDAPPSNSLTVSVPITNTGSVAGAEVVQAYVHDPKSRIPRPEKELRAFARVELAPGETKWVHMALDKYAVGYYDTSLGAWIAEEGQFDVLIAASSADIRSKISFAVPESFTWIA
ncbi:hypothetical protein AJ80_04563 [Polytolypa hystricis UAMH7299]|uniref:beta-glucosidase n=1 Tax=Polytolypa hystricis (strain UAMH7299) TaxID=1447883 RepID=A0A2B7Y9H6_POLH7|nr:hypothetical protein AJ80_04563 [Polytolypa hystricis UAMH7299]